MHILQAQFELESQDLHDSVIRMFQLLRRFNPAEPVVEKSVIL